MFFGSIFGSNGNSYHRVGNQTFDEKGDSITHSGGSAFDSEGGERHDVGDTSFLSNGSEIRKIGSTYFCNGKTYNLVGNTLFGPNEQSWSGDIDDMSARDIISRDQ